MDPSALTLMPEWPDAECPVRELFCRAGLAFAEGDRETCLRLLAEALGEAEGRHGPGHPQSLHIGTFLARHLRHGNQPERAIPLLRRGLQAAEVVLGADHRSLVEVHLELATCLERLGSIDEGLSNRLRAQRILREVPAEEPDDLDDPEEPQPTSEVERLIFEALDARLDRDLDATEALLLQALDVGERTLGWDHPHTARALSELASVDWDRGRSDLWRRRVYQALEIYRRTTGSESEDVEHAYNDLAYYHQMLGDYAQAEQCCRQALALREQRYPGALHPLNSRIHLAECVGAQGRREEAASLFRRVQQEWCRWHPERLVDPDRLPEWWAIVYLGQGTAEQAERLEAVTARTVTLYEKTCGPDHLHVAEQLDPLAALRRHLGRMEAAEEAATRAEAIRARIRESC